MLIAEAARFPELADAIMAEILQPCWKCSSKPSSAVSDRGEIAPIRDHQQPAGVIAPIALSICG